jgi:hypothetical protein
MMKIKRKIFGYDVADFLIECYYQPVIFALKLNMTYNDNNLLLCVRGKEDNKFFSTELSKKELKELKNKTRTISSFFNKTVFVFITDGLSKPPIKVYIPEKEELKDFQSNIDYYTFSL